ncbi:DNA-directed RNA polymerase III subunit RPC4 [Drosophila innubila]|uniref:DNA-directed RNA polymerase III subunit RPC4 n=1 Tax=Drosophila innubila TaxID=198719 RepID=UPI00148B85CB|nr:DNA-directed RNA polymerase III subunit RPC4 [Drosophila innubila]
MASDSDKGQQKSAMPAKRLSATAPPVAAAGANNNSNGATGDAASQNKMMNGMTRLTPARDLTLGGRGASKKVFAPNLNAVRNKNTNVKTSKDFTQPRGGRGRGARGAGAARGRGGAGGGGNSSLIQTTGVFSEGAGAVHLRKSSSGGSAYARAGEEVAVSRKRTDRKDDKFQDQRVRELIGEASDDDEADSDNETELNKTDLTYKPIMLSEGLWHSQKHSVKEESASIPNLKPKKEESLDITQDLQSLHMAAQSGLEEPPAQYGRYPRSIGAFLEATQSQIFVMQLPNVLPCVTDDADDVPAAKEQPAPSTSTDRSNSPIPSTTAVNAPKHSVLHQLEEGQIGKILRYKSGRVKLLLGDTRFDLDMGLESGFLQELMSVSSNREQRSGDMINLGTIQAKLKATPDWVHLFEQQEKATRQAAPASGIQAASST